MQLTEDLLKIDPGDTQQKITRFIKDYVVKSKAKGLVLGVSGGVDSATTTALCTIAIGAVNVVGLYMPEKETYNQTDRKHVKQLAKKFQFQLETIDLTNPLNTLYDRLLHKMGRRCRRHVPNNGSLQNPSPTTCPSPRHTTRHS